MDRGVANVKVLERADLSVIASPLRRQLLEALSEPDSASSLARRLGMSRQRVGYHMRGLERAGFLELVAERQQRGCTERLYRARQLTYVLESGSDQGKALKQEQDRFSWAGLMSLAARVVRELVLLRKRADDLGKRAPTLAIETSVTFATPGERQAFTEEIAAAVQQVVRKYHSGDAARGRQYRVFLGAYPSVEASTQKGTEQ